MFEQRHREIIEQGDKLFGERGIFIILCQELAENFYPERADFTAVRTVGDTFANNLDTSYPIQARRDLGNAFEALMRPPGKNWFNVRLKREQNEDEEARRWLEKATRIQRRALYDRESNFMRATKEADHDFACFGQCVISSEPALSPTTGAILLHRNWHLRDVAWSVNSYGRIDDIHRKWKPGARELVNLFPKTVHPSVRKLAVKEPFTTLDVRHIVVLSADYEKKFKTPYVSLYLDVENQHVLEEIGSTNQIYVIPRWQTVSGSQYAYSPAAIAALPDARLLQAMTYTLLTAGEFAVSPALIGVQEAIKGGLEIFPGGFTAVDAAYDERLGEVLRPLEMGGAKGIPLGLKMNQDTRMMIADAFYLSKLSLPQAGLGGMSPYEVSQRMEEFIRQALPLFEPMEPEYNGALMELDFDILLRNGAFGPAASIPESLRGQETEFRFESPLRESLDRLKGQQFLEAKNLIAEGAQLDPMAPKMINARTALRDSLRGIGIPATWMTDEAEMEALDQQAQQAQKMMSMVQAASAGGQAAEQVGKGGQAIKEMMTPNEQPGPAAP